MVNSILPARNSRKSRINDPKEEEGDPRYTYGHSFFMAT
jgi:hypothetical protein